jgi:16S rRNA pseudouridine516 synthase
MIRPRRLDQILASLGYGSRKEVRGWIARGRVEVRGEMCLEEDLHVLPSEVTIDGSPLEAPEGILAMLHKPVGYTCSHSTKEGPTIYELLPEQWLRRNPPVTSVGRLDKETSGLLLITDQGNLVQRWTSPKSDIQKVYLATVDKPLKTSLIDVFGRGDLWLNGEDKPCLPAKLEILDDLHARLILSEGRYHQVRRMFASQGWEVLSLHRSHFGEYDLGDMEAGKCRMLELPK